MNRLKDVEFLRKFYDGVLGVIEILLGLYLLRGLPAERLIDLPDWTQTVSQSPLYAILFIIGGLVLAIPRRERSVAVSLIALTPLLSVYLLQLYLSLTNRIVIRSSAFNILFEMMIITVTYLLFRISENTNK